MVKFGRNRSTAAPSAEDTGTASQSQGTGRNLENVVTNQPQMGNIPDLPPSYSYEGRRVPGPSPYGPPPPYSTAEGEHRGESFSSKLCRYK